MKLKLFQYFFTLVRHNFLGLTVFLLLLVSPLAASGLTLTLTLGYPGAQPDSYKLYYSTTSQGYSSLHGQNSTSNPYIITLNTVDQNGNYIIDGPFVPGTRYFFAATAVVSNNESWFSQEFILDIPQSSVPNSPPTSIPGPPQTVTARDTVYLNGSFSFDSDGSIANYEWTQTDGVAVSLFNSQIDIASFIAPPVSLEGTVLQFQLKVTDDSGASTTNLVDISVLPKAPVSGGVFQEIISTGIDATNPDGLLDTYTNLDHFNYSSSADLQIWSWSSFAPHNPANTILIKPEVGSIPPGTFVTKATLSLYLKDSYGSPDYEASIHPLDNIPLFLDEATGYNASTNFPWTTVPEGMTSNNIPLGLANIGPAEDIIPITTVSQWYTWHITSMVQSWADQPFSNNGLLIQPSVSPDIESGKTFASSNDPTLLLRPKVSVTYIATTDTDQDFDFDGLDIFNIAQQLTSLEQ